MAIFTFLSFSRSPFLPRASLLSPSRASSSSLPSSSTPRVAHDLAARRERELGAGGSGRFEDDDGGEKVSI